MHSITHIAVILEATQTVAWPHYAGSTLRGAFGRALRRAACITGQQKCTGCPLRNSCAYGVVFDPAAPAQPIHPSFRDGLPRYVVQPPALGACTLRAGQTQSFSLLLLPGTQAHHGLIEHVLRVAVERELMQPGLFRLVHTKASHTPVAPALSAPGLAGTSGATPVKPTPVTDQITLRWHAPLRLQNHGKPMFKPMQLDASTLVRALLRRQMQWHQIIHQAPARVAPGNPDPLACAAGCTLDTRNLQWHDIQRHSATQGQNLPLGGPIGSATLHGPTPALQTLLPLLQLGEQLHIGKETVMGLGHYRLGLRPGGGAPLAMPRAQTPA